MRKGERTRLKILENTIILFAEKGFDGTSIQNIADETGLSQAAVFQHFKNKKVLLDAVRQHITEDVMSFISGKLDSHNPARKELEAYVLGTVEWSIKNRSMAQIILLNYYFACFDDDFHRHLKFVMARAENRVMGYLLACQREGDLDKNANVEQLSQQIHDFIVGIAFKLQASTRKTRMDKALKARCLDFIDHMLTVKG